MHIFLVEYVLKEYTFHHQPLIIESSEEALPCKLTTQEKVCSMETGCNNQYFVTTFI